MVKRPTLDLGSCLDLGVMGSSSTLGAPTPRAEPLEKKILPHSFLFFTICSPFANQEAYKKATEIPTILSRDKAINRIRFRYDTNAGTI